MDNSNLKNRTIEITYLCPAADKAIGGIKVIYKHSEILSNQGISSSVFHPENQKFVCTWFEHKTIMRETRPFVSGEDFIVIPEVWAIPFALQCIEKKLDYAIFVQNGYLLNERVIPQNYGQLKSAYENAKLIMSISTDTTDMICLAYPSLDRKKIYRLLPHLGKSFKSSEKEKIISYMPRKLPEHSGKLLFYLREYLPQNWKLLPINDFTEAQVAEALGKSAIFLSFSDQEGCALPPLEAALSGALVVGYSGQGGREYFNHPNFIEIQNGDFKSFVRAVAKAIKEVEGGLLESKTFLAGISSLLDSYGSDNELKHLLKFAEAVRHG